jgi:23S rRNA (guanosine2251-2'-O)-methyltransferase
MKFLKNDELGRASDTDFIAAEKLPVTVILDNVRSGLNIGSVFRSSDSFLIEKIILCGITAVPPARDILKSALGATQTVSWEYYDKTWDAVEALQHKGYFIYAIEQSDVSTSLESLVLNHSLKYALIFGNEVKGVDASLIPLLNGCIEIPQSGTKHSLNIAVCAGIVLWKFYELLKLRQ